jgi:tetratricopeptide (TPR) repeat protein
MPTGMFSNAEEEFEKIRLSLPELATFCQAMADMFQGKHAAALAILQELEKRPLGVVDLRELRLLLARALLLDLTDNKRAKFFFDDIFRNSLVYGHLAEMSSFYFLAQGGRAGEAGRSALPAFDRLINRARGDFMTRLWLFYDAYVYGRTMEMAGDRAEAARGYRACIDANPYTDLAARSRQRLRLLRKTP